MASRVDTLKRVGILLLQFFVTAAGLWYVFHEPQKRAQIAVALKQADRIWLILGWLCYSVVEILATVRWQILLRIQGIRLSWLRAGAIVMIGLFFNQFLPGGIGGDAMRLYFVFKLAPGRKVSATLSVAMDRLLGLLTLLFLSGMSLSLRFNALTRSSPSPHIVYLVLALLGRQFCVRCSPFLGCERRAFTRTAESNAISESDHRIWRSAAALSRASYGNGIRFSHHRSGASGVLHKLLFRRPITARLGSCRQSRGHFVDHAARGYNRLGTHFAGRSRRARNPLSRVAWQSFACPAGARCVYRVARLYEPGCLGTGRRCHIPRVAKNH
jgi:hypothetical protein